MGWFDRFRKQLIEPAARYTVHMVKALTFEQVYGHEKGEYESDNYDIPDCDEGYERAYILQVTVRRCINLMSRCVGSVPLKLFRRTEGGGRELVQDHDVLDLLATVNDYQNSIDLWRQTTSDVKTYGRAYWRVVRKRPPNGPPVAIHRLVPKKVKPVPDPKRYVKQYEYRPSSDKTVLYSPGEIIHFRYPDPRNEYDSLSPIKAIRNEVELYLYATAWNTKFFKNGGSPDGFISVKDELSDEQRTRIRQSYKEAHVGLKNAHKVGVFEAGAVWQPTSITARDADWGGLLGRCELAICKGLDVSPILIQGTDSKNFRAVWENESDFWHNTIIPELRWYEEILNWSLLPMYKDSAGLFFEFDINEVPALRREAIEHTQRYTEATGAPYLTVNEARLMNGLPALPDGEKLAKPRYYYMISGGRDRESAERSMEELDRIERDEKDQRDSRDESDESDGFGR